MLNLRAILNKLSYYLNPSVHFIGYFIGLFLFSLYAYHLSSWEIFGIGASFLGIYGILISSRQILRKGFEGIKFDQSHIDYEADITQDLIDTDAKLKGTVMVFISAILVFISNIYI